MHFSPPTKARSEEHTSELQSHSDLHSFPTRRSSDLFFYTVPKAFLPIGDSSFALGVFVAQEGTSHYEMHTHQMQVEEVLHTNPAVDMTFTMSGNNAFFPANQGQIGRAHV